MFFGPMPSAGGNTMWHSGDDRLTVAVQDLGHDYFDRLDRDRLVRYHTRRLTDLGVILPPLSPASATA
jgi:hypothetical protein